MNKLTCIGHRGACGHEPENTLRSFQKALDLGADGIELDVYLVDNELVVIHDDTLERTTNGSGRVINKPLRELRLLDAGKGEKIPFLREVLDLVSRRAWVNIELKGPNTAGATVKLIEDTLARGEWKITDFLVSSFNHSELRQARALKSDLPIGVLFGHWRHNLVAYAKRLDPLAIHVAARLVKPSLVEEAHRNGLKVFVYTVNEPEELQRLKALGVDGVFTNFPERVIAANFTP